MDLFLQSMVRALLPQMDHARSMSETQIGVSLLPLQLNLTSNVPESKSRVFDQL
jgi:hypothetical protein